MKKIAIYVRVSTTSQTTDNQVNELQSYCQRNEYEIFKVYRDEGISGAESNRPALNNMISDSRKGKFDAVLVWKIDRIARSITNLLQILSDLKAYGVGFISMTEGINTETAQGRMLASFLGAIAEFERELIKERVKAGGARARVSGVKLGRPRRGFDVSKAMTMKKDGASWSQVAKSVGASPATVRRTVYPLLDKVT